ncbi:aminopeptidase N [Geoalkalibacter ferrihydriticus]|uniref:Aminopeptidase N n=2 Tax=Geoalkalibacter ferrihydriticus TaxID=392333 RepID=A0A0C2HRH6_9BACT|nr:aminopeptidase N [Geoalkalibacter ferrihydriticus]KIH77465.1 aminopeptidase N [Geoalkalibacter ferrihydriticus DSM 17813]SDM13913.1 aminopeptidase N [Geoalkalibacter ferrihydriticus]
MNPNQTINLDDYRPPAYLVNHIDLRFDLDESRTRVTALLEIVCNPQGSGAGSPLVLDGNNLELVKLRLDGRELSADEYSLEGERLVLGEVPVNFSLEIETLTDPSSNAALEGLYLSGGNFCTQCEPEGFRRITYFPDRPDVMAGYRTTIVADRARYPVLLANGNRVAHGELEGGKHFAEWVDPFPKPSYLFALVAGKLACLEDTFTTRSRRAIKLQIYVEAHNLDQCAHAMHSLKKAMRWDEERFGLECDLDQYMVVAVDDFNMGAMENKGLNIFNSKYVLARSDTATDVDFENIEGVIGHEYFHNWTGNRVTCRDWFQLSLKEGLTVFRDQEFSADMSVRAIKRIADVRLLRTAQFAEDAGPMAHPVRPSSYEEINNFYTLTVYHKGAEVIRMMHTLLGEQGFRRGMDLYFQRHDGQAVTTDDFVRAMEDAGAIDLVQFRRWYTQAGTPQVHVERHYDPQSHTYTLTLSQSCPATPGQDQKLPFHIPVAVGLLDGKGHSLPLHLEGETEGAAPHTRVLSLTEAQQTFRFTGVRREPVPSLLRDFSAPVKLTCDFSDDELAFLAGHDSDAFTRWDSGQQLALRVLLRMVDDFRQARTPQAPGALSAALRRTLGDTHLEAAFKAQALQLPSEAYVAEQMAVIDPLAVHQARDYLLRHLAKELRTDLLAGWQNHMDAGPYHFEPEAVGRRSLKNACLGYLTRLDEQVYVDLCVNQAQQGRNMTDVLAALSHLAQLDCPESDAQLAAFYDKWQAQPLVVDKWFTLQATSSRADTATRVSQLLQHPAFTLRNPNRVRSLLGAFSQGNPVHFHAASGAGYRLLGEHVCKIDAFNPQLAARLVSAFNHWRRYDAQRQMLMKEQLEQILDQPGLSRDVREVAGKSLGQ